MWTPQTTENNYNPIHKRYGTNEKWHTEQRSSADKKDLIKMDDDIVWRAMNHYTSNCIAWKEQNEKTLRISTVRCTLFAVCVCVCLVFFSLLRFAQRTEFIAGDEKWIKTHLMDHL